MPGPGEEFAELVRRILLANEFTLGPNIQNLGFDFLGAKGTEKWAIEVKFYRTKRAQASLIQRAASWLSHGIINTDAKGMLVLSCELPRYLRFELHNEFNFAFVDRANLILMAAKSPTLLSELQSMLEIAPDEVLSAEEAISEFTATDVPQTERQRLGGREGIALCKELLAARCGKSNWADYEKLCERILRYLFPNDLSGWHRQKRTDDGLNRYDFVCRIRGTTGFWEFLTHHLDSRYVVFEFKNYCGFIKQGQILTTEKYLLDKALRRVAIIFSRKGADDHAHKTVQGAMREHGKLMLVLDDDRICQMLHMKEKGEDPTDFLFDLADDFLLALPR